MSYNTTHTHIHTHKEQKKEGNESKKKKKKYFNRLENRIQKIENEKINQLVALFLLLLLLLLLFCCAEIKKEEKSYKRNLLLLLILTFFPLFLYNNKFQLSIDLVFYFHCSNSCAFIYYIFITDLSKTML